MNVIKRTPRVNPCPVCTAKTDKILVCEHCWNLVPLYDQIGFRSQFRRWHPKHPASYQPKAEKIVRNLRVMKGLPPLTEPLRVIMSTEFSELA